MSGLFQSLFSALSPASAGGSIDVHGLHAALANDEVPVLIDVRTPGEYAGGHVPQAINIPLSSIANAPQVDGWKDVQVHVICQSGARSGSAQAILAGKGIDVVNVRGGTGAWRAAGYEVAR